MKVAYLSGGVGGAKLALGLSKILKPAELSIIANTGDDFEHLGLPICPDIDTLVYTLSDLANTELGWGRKDETGHFMETMKALGGPDWFFLGDRDLAMHTERRRLMKEGLGLTEITARLAHKLGVRHRILPMCNDSAPTSINTAEGWLPFQDYFVRLRAEPKVTGFGYHGGMTREISPNVHDALAKADLIVIGPSNPLISIAPITSLGKFDRAIAESGAPVVAVSPIVGGQAIKGPTAKMMRELGTDPSVLGIAKHYAGYATHMVIDAADQDHAAEVEAIVGGVSVTGTVMRSLEDRVALARHVLDLKAQ
ncbi:2-phospho-L-lactate transferase [Minwuia sp.]|uniref:2-phospho-L-lactate transferase n=1 Tax=Minwuia sp. TaxID=2493630 RepID=UPI003A8D6074